jgi:2-polyprenyl-3-methyl-5-hydroxy-6-metoxy-1,4-benzoquinol methylase
MMSDQHSHNEQASATNVQVPTCPITHSTDAQKLCVVDGYQVWRCASSGTDFVWPMPTDQELKEYYDRADYFEGGEHGGYTDYDVQTEPSLQMVTELLDRFPVSNGTLSVLDVGCSYGSHLRLAADRQWQCFGVELSDHARKMAKERHGDLMTIVESANDLPVRRYDIVMMLEVIEHLQDPYPLFATLFEKGAIGPDTLVVITTPNARSNDAIADPAKWEFRHPPSHLVYYSALSFQLLMQKLGFRDVFVRGLVDMPAKQTFRYADETSALNDAWDCTMGICAEGLGWSMHTHAANSEAKPQQFDSPDSKTIVSISNNESENDSKSRSHALALQARELVLRERTQILKQREDKVRELSKELNATRAWVDEMNKAKEWLEKEHAALSQTYQRAIAEHERELAELRAWTSELDKGKEWLAAQNTSLDQSLKQCQQVLGETQNRLDIAMNSRGWRVLNKLGLVPKI